MRLGERMSLAKSAVQWSLLLPGLMGNLALLQIDFEVQFRGNRYVHLQDPKIGRFDRKNIQAAKTKVDKQK